METQTDKPIQQSS